MQNILYILPVLLSGVAQRGFAALVSGIDLGTAFEQKLDHITRDGEMQGPVSILNRGRASISAPLDPSTNAVFFSFRTVALCKGIKPTDVTLLISTPSSNRNSTIFTSPSPTAI